MHEGESPIFIVGCPRSGTSLLRDLLRSHPHLTFPQESHFIPSFFRGYGDPCDDREAQKLAKRILTLHWIQDWGIGFEPATFAACRTFREIVSALFQAWALKENKPRWGDKTPHYVMEIPTLLEIFPPAKIIHVYRDGRDVALSWLKTGFEPRNIYTAAALWRRYVLEGRKAAQIIPSDSYLEVRYETLLVKPEETMRKVCAFISEAFDTAVLRVNYLDKVPRSRILRNHPVIPISKTHVVRNNLEKWKDNMSLSERSIFESMAGDLLASLGYETERLGMRIPRAKKMIWRSHHILGWVASRINTKKNYRMLVSHLHLRWARMRHRFGYTNTPSRTPPRI